MPIFTSSLDRAFLRSLSREFTNKVVGQEVLYYKLSLDQTEVNSWGESKDKIYQQPILLTCLWEAQDQDTENGDYGISRNQLIDFKFLRTDLIYLNLVCESGDVIVRNEAYYEVDSIVENQFLQGKNPEYSLQADNDLYGESWSIICKTHLTKVNRLNLIQSS